MRDEVKGKRGFVDWGLVATLALCLFALIPLMTKGGIVHGHDTLLHAHRVAEMQRSWAHGLFLPIWAETFYYGYGSPVFHYYSPLAYYFGAAGLTLGISIVDTIRLLIASSLLCAGTGMYLFVREQFGKAGALLSALCYVYSPYLLYTEPYTRGDYPELLAFAVFPFVMWRFERLIRRVSAANMARATLSIAPLILSHNLMAVALFGLMIAWLLWRTVTRTLTLQRFMLAFITAMLGVGLMTHFWLPVALERDLVQIDNVEQITEGRRRNFFEFFIPAERLFALTRLTDAGAANGVLMHINLGVAQAVLAVSGVLGGIILNRQDAKFAKKNELLQKNVFFALATTIMIVIMLPAAYPFWATFSPINYLVFPWRFLGPVAFCLAVLAGGNVGWLTRLPHRLHTFFYAVCLLAPLALSLPLLHIPERYTAPLDTSVSAYVEGEITGTISLGTTAYNEFLPQTVYVLPTPSPALTDALALTYPVDHANRQRLPSGTTLELLAHHPERSVWHVVSDEAFTMEVLTFYFAGWQAVIDGQPAPITPSDQHGLITFPVPAGEHTITLWLGAAPVRDAAVALSVVAVLAAIVLCLYLRRWSTTEVTSMPAESFPKWAAAGIFIAQCIMITALHREGITWLNSPLGQALPAQHQAHYQLGDQMQLVGYDVSSLDVRAGDQIEVVMYWYAQQPPSYNYASFVHVSSGGPPLAQLDKRLVADRPSAAWTADGYLIDRYIVSLPADMPAGEYQLLVGVYTCETRPIGECGNGDRLQVISADGETLGDSVLLGTVRVH